MKINQCKKHKKNCVSSLNSLNRNSVKPLPFKSDLRKTKEAILAAGNAVSEGRLVKSEGNYFHFICTSKVLKFKDDLEFEIDEDQKVVHVKSASRVGVRDFGVNKKRLDQVRSLWNQR